MPCFIDAEPPPTKMSNFFPLTKWISANLGSDPPVFVTAQLPLSTPESVVSCIQPLLDCTTKETTKVVIFRAFFLSQ